MEIGIDASRANRDYKSGTEWYAYHIIRWLAKLDKKNKYILYSDKPLKGSLIDLGSEDNKSTKNLKPDINNDNFQKIISPHNNFKAKILKWPFKYFWTQGRLSLEMILNKPNVLFVPAHALPIIHPKRSIVTIHDIGYEKDKTLYEEEKIGAEDSRIKKIINFFIRLLSLGKYGANSVDYLKWSTEYASKKAYKIITPSNFTKNDIKIFFEKNCDNIEVIYHGYNKNLYKKINDESKIDEVLNKYEIKRPYLFYIGRIEKKKNISALVEAFSLFKEKNKDNKHKLILVGVASYGYDEVNYMINEFELDGDIVITGWVEEEDIPYLYNGASAFIFPSKYEGFGIPLLQAMACEVPIAASNRASIPEITGEAALLFDPSDVRLIAFALEKIIYDDNLRLNLIQEGIKRVKYFSWEKSAQKTLEVLNGFSRDI